MNKFEENEFAEIEEKLKNEVENIEVKSFDQVMKTIRPELRSKKNKVFTPIVKRMVAATASIVILLAVGLTIYFTLDGSQNEYFYGDDNITISDTIKSEVVHDPALAILNLDILFNDSYQIATHKDSLETVCYMINAYSTDGVIIRNFNLTVISQPKYTKADEIKYLEGDKESVLGIEMIIINLNNFEPPFYNYRIGFSIDDVRYYFDYQTISEENDIESFMSQFIKQ